MNDRLKNQIVLCASFVVASLGAETLVMGKAGSGENPHSFYIATDWIREDGSVVNAAPTAGNDYVVANGYEMNVNTTAEFAGDSLQFGYVGGTEGRFWHTGGGNEVTVQRLILANGWYRVWQNKMAVATSHVKGTTEVLSPATAPFLISPTHIGSATSYTIQWDSVLSGKAGTGILVASLSTAIGEGTPKLVLTGDNSAYYGSIAVKDTNLTFSVTQASALGGVLSEFDADALSLDERCIFECTAESETLPASANRGITVGSGGAKIHTPAGKTLCVEWPIALEGVLEKTGEGTLFLASQMTLGDNGGFAVSEGYVSVRPGTTAAIDGITFSGGAFAVSYDAESGASGVLELGGMPVDGFRVRPPAERGIKVPFLRVPVSAGEVTASDFIPIADLASSGLPSFAVTVETESGYHVVYIETAETVTPADGASALYALQNPECWSDNQLLHSLGDYVVNGKTAGKAYSFSVGDLASLDESVLDYTMPAGTSLTFTGADGKIATWNIRQRTFTGDIRAVGNRIEFRSCGNTEPAKTSPYEESREDVHVLKGRLYVDNDAPSDAGLRIMTGCSRTLKIESEISGDGTICLRTMGNSAPTRSATYILSGTNSFTGKFFMYGGYDAASTNVLRFSDQCNLGPGGRVSGVESTLLLQGNSDSRKFQMVIHPIGSVKVDLPARPLYFYAGNLNVKVDDGHELKWDSRIMFRSGTANNLTEVRKLGGGTFAVGGDVELVSWKDVADVWTFYVDEGHIRADNARAFSGMTMTFNGGGIAAKYDPEATGESAQYGMIVTNSATFTVSGDKLPVKVETGGDMLINKRIAVITVPADFADEIGGKLSGTCDLPKGGVVFVRENVTLDEAQYVRFSAEIRRGTVITVR